MPKGPLGEKRPADVIGCAVLVAKIAIGDEIDGIRVPAGRRRSGVAGAAARAQRLSRQERSDIAKEAAAKRWAAERGV